VKSRKSAKVSSKSRRADRHRESLRGAIRAFETLEDRKLMTASPWSDGMYYPPIGKYTAFLPPSITASQYAARSNQQYGGSSNSSGLNGEGLQPFISMLESEPNNLISQANYINLGTSPDKSDGATVAGILTSPTTPGGTFIPDVDYYAFDLRAGDIVDARLNAQLGRVFDLSIMDANRREIIATQARTPNVYPIGSPLNVDHACPTPSDGIAAGGYQANDFP